MQSDLWTLYCDGTALPNPGRIAIGAVLSAPDGTRHTLSQVTGTHGCNNEAEVRALIAALHLARSQGAQSLRVHSDSSILIEQLAASPAAAIVRLDHVFAEARALLQNFEHIELCWVPRHRNTEADVLARAALGLVVKPPHKPRRKRRR